MKQHIEIIWAEKRLDSLNDVRAALSRWIRATQPGDAAPWMQQTAERAEEAEAILAEVARLLESIKGEGIDLAAEIKKRET